MSSCKPFWIHLFLPKYIGELIVSKYVAELINNLLQVVLATKAFVAETSCNKLLINSATYLLTINSPILMSVAMSLYDIIP